MNIFAALLFSGVLFSLAADGLTTIPVTREGRKIQLDGFLLEWNMDSAKTSLPDSLSTVDAIKTVEGLAGFAKIPKNNRWIIRLIPDITAPQKAFTAHVLQNDTLTFLKFDTAFTTSTNIEWLLPWHIICTDSITAFDCGLWVEDTLQKSSYAWRFTGSHSTLKPVSGTRVIITTQMIFQGIIILVLLSIFFIMRLKIGRLEKSRVSRKQ